MPSWNEHWVHPELPLRPNMRTLHQMVFMALPQGSSLGGMEVRPGEGQVASLPGRGSAVREGLQGRKPPSDAQAPAVLWDEQE